MKKWLVLLPLLFLVIFVACGGPAAPTATPKPTAAAPVVVPTATTTPTSIPTPNVDLAAILRQHYDAINKDDVAATAALFTDDASLVRGGCSSQAPCVGTAAIQRQLERSLAVQHRYSVINIQVSGDTATGQVEFRNLNVKNAGLERVIENFSASFKGDKISRLAHELDLSDSQSAAFANFRRVTGIATRL